MKKRTFSVGDRVYRTKYPSHSRALDVPEGTLGEVIRVRTGKKGALTVTVTFSSIPTGILGERDIRTIGWGEAFRNSKQWPLRCIARLPTQPPINKFHHIATELFLSSGE